MSNLIYSMKTLLQAIFERDVNIRLRPGYFPFVEPGFELDIECQVCGGKDALCARRQDGLNSCHAASYILKF